MKKAWQDVKKVQGQSDFSLRGKGCARSINNIAVARVTPSIVKAGLFSTWRRFEALFG